MQNVHSPLDKGVNGQVTQNMCAHRRTDVYKKWGRVLLCTTHVTQSDGLILKYYGVLSVCCAQKTGSCAYFSRIPNSFSSRKKAG